MSNSKTIQATLFYQTSTDIDFGDLGARLRSAFAETQVNIRPRLMSDNDLAFAVGGLTLTVSRSQDALNTDHLANCRRPLRAQMTRQEAVDGMRRHQCAVVICISGPDYVAQKQTRLGICLIAALQVLGLHQPQYLHWSGSDTLYSTAEFAATTAASDQPLAKTASFRTAENKTKANAWMSRAYSTSSAPVATPEPVRRKPAHVTTSAQVQNAPDRAHMASPYDAGSVLQNKAYQNRRSAAPMLHELFKSLRAA